MKTDLFHIGKFVNHYRNSFISLALNPAGRITDGGIDSQCKVYTGVRRIVILLSIGLKTESCFDVAVSFDPFSGCCYFRIGRIDLSTY